MEKIMNGKMDDGITQGILGKGVRIWRFRAWA